jgi:predicted transcriptional regulator
VRILPVEVQPESLRRYDFHSRQLRLSELLSPASRAFALGYQLALIEAKSTLDTLIAQADMPDEQSQRLLRLNLANYFAGALLMPYSKFHAASEATGYDIMLLTARFGVSFEQVCHRLTTLQRPTARGIPFGLLRVDEAGTISKRFAAGRFPFAKLGGSCALWSLHQSFRTPGTLLTQIVEMPEGDRYFSLCASYPAHTKSHNAIVPHYAVALMCELRYAPLLTYAGGLNLETPSATPIGPACPLCTQPHCRQRSQPPLHKSMVVDLHSKTASPYRFE